MKAVWIGKYGNSSVLEIKNLAQPKPRADEALIRLKAAGLNLIDIYMREGVQHISLPFVPGLEAAGIVEIVGDAVIGIRPGDHVAYAGALGSYAEYNIVKASKLILLPNEISFEQGAAFLFQGLAACYFMHKNHEQIKAGSRVLIHAAAGGIGLILVQWLKSMGAFVIGTVSTSSKARVVLEAGADQVFFYADWDKIRKIDTVIDESHSTIPSLPFNPVKRDNNFQFEKIYSRYANEILDQILVGHLGIKINHVFPLEKAAEAQKLLGCRETIGKIILKIN